MADWDRLLERVAGWFSVERLTSDRVDALADFFVEAYRDQPIAEAFRDPDVVRRRVRWSNERNPVRFEDRLAAWLCLRNGRIVGHFGVIAADLAVDGTVTPICWGRDLIVAADARRLGAGPFLVMSAVRDVRTPLLVAGLNEDARVLYAQLGFEDRGVIPVLIKVHDAARLVETMPWPELKRRAGSIAIAARQMVANRPRRKARALTIEPIERFDEEFDRWWRGVEPACGAVVRRTAATMTWRYQEHPAHRYQAFAARDGAGLRGVVVVRSGRSRGLPAGFISELLAGPDDREALDSLIGHAAMLLETAETERPVFVRCTAHHPAIEDALARNGFLRAPSPLRWMANAPDGVRALPPADRWMLTAGDSDLDMV